MPAELLEGKTLAAQIREKLGERVAQLRERAGRHQVASDGYIDFQRFSYFPNMKQGVTNNIFGHKNVVNWLISQGVEPVLPPISKFFLNAFASKEARIEGNITERSTPKFITDWIEKYAYKIIRKMEAGIRHYPFYIPVSNVYEDAAAASKIINLNSQIGEGWGVAAEFGVFAHNGVNNVGSPQPFGCIANHVISKGIEKRTREIYPNLNLLFLDFDSGMSEANIFNRLHFMIKNAEIEKPLQTGLKERLLEREVV